MFLYFFYCLIKIILYCELTYYLRLCSFIRYYIIFSNIFSIFTANQSFKKKLVKMAQPDCWEYCTKNNCMLKQSDTITELQCLPRMKLKSYSADKSFTIKVKNEALTPANNLQQTHDTRCRKQKSERRLTIEHPPLKLRNHARALALLTPIVPSPTKSPPTKKSKSGARFVGCCSCNLK